MATKREWTDEEVQAEIAAAVKIVAEDKERAQYLALHERFGAKPDDSNQDPGKTPPPAKDDPKPDDKPKKRSLWWGETDE